MMIDEKKRESFGSRIGFVLAPGFTKEELRAIMPSNAKMYAPSDSAVENHKNELRF